MTIFEGMCIGFTAGVVGTLICVLGGALIDKHMNSHDNGRRIKQVDAEGREIDGD